MPTFGDIRSSTTMIIIDASGNVVINEDGAAKDFRVEAIGQPNALFVSGIDGAVGVRTNMPTDPLDVRGEVLVRVDTNQTSPNVLRLANLDATPVTLHGVAWTAYMSQTGQGNQLAAGKMVFGKQEEWTTTPSTNNAFVAWEVKSNGVMVEIMRVTSTGYVGVGEPNPDYQLDVNGTFGFAPGSSVTPVDNGDVVIEATNDTTLTLKLKESDGVIRSGTVALA